MSANEYEFVMGYLRPHLNRPLDDWSIPDRPLDEPEGDPREKAEAEMQADIKYQEARDETLCGRGKFWVLGAEGADCEYDSDIFKAVSAALRLPCASPIQRWAYLQREINRLADSYAAMVRDGDA